MTRVVVADCTAGAPSEQGEPATVGLARRLRDAGREVVYVGPGVTPEVVVAAALQEDVDEIVLPSRPGVAEACAVLGALLEERGAADVDVVVD